MAKSNAKDEISKIKALSDGMTLEKVNDIMELMKYCTDRENTVASTAIKATGRAFTLLSKEKQLSGAEAQKVDRWINQQKDKFVEILLRNMQHNEEEFQILALNTLMECVFQQEVSQSGILQKVIRNIIFNKNLGLPLFSTFKNKYLLMKDVRLGTLLYLKDLISLFQKDASKTISDIIFCENVFLLLSAACVKQDDSKADPDLDSDNEEPEEDILGGTGKKRKASGGIQRPAKKANHGPTKTVNVKRAYDKAWLEFLSMSRVTLPNNIYCKILEEIPGVIIPNMAEPILLLDFLTEIFNRNAVNLNVSLLAFKGLFVLITKHNLDYPQFYPKLYSLLDQIQEVIVPSTRSTTDADFQLCKRFFKLLQIFLQSSMLPTYMVAGFLKKLVRVCLVSVPSFSLIILPVIQNILLQHPTAQTLLHDVDSTQNKSNKGDKSNSGPLKLSRETNVPVDCYNPNVSLDSCKALNSSLWELQAIMNHYHTGSVSGQQQIKPDEEAGEDNTLSGAEMGVASRARSFRNKITNRTAKSLIPKELPSYQTLFDHEMKRKVKEGIPAAFVAPNSFESISSQSKNTPPFFKGWEF